MKVYVSVDLLDDALGALERRRGRRCRSGCVNGDHDAGDEVRRASAATAKPTMIAITAPRGEDRPGDRPHLRDHQQAGEHRDEDDHRTIDSRRRTR